MTPEQAALPGMAIQKPVKHRRAAVRRCSGCGWPESQALPLRAYATTVWCTPCMAGLLGLPKRGNGGG